MNIAYELTGYDRVTHSLKISHDVPLDQAEHVKRVTPEIDAGDGLGSLALTDHQASVIADIMHLDIPFGEYDYFLEPFADESQRVAL